AMSIFPNPTSGMLNVTSNEEIDSIEIFNSVGTTVVSSNVAGNSSAIDMSNLPNGMYFVRVSTANGIETVKVVLER
ncbi:MAG: T9SS type A sorting domain-containing protein, partial [Bacteroidales bacterium]|nr:T9SS type A sorting domain-containing protein [Bacteroidales bacterium]